MTELRPCLACGGEVVPLFSDGVAWAIHKSRGAYCDLDLTPVYLGDWNALMLRLEANVVKKFVYQCRNSFASNTEIPQEDLAWMNRLLAKELERTETK